jgi:hypothetical protein
MNKIIKYLQCRLFHKKYWVGTPSYFWVNDRNTLYCNCEKCNRDFERDICMKDWKSGKIQQEIRIDMKI